MGSTSLISSHLKKIAQRQSKYVLPFCSANHDPISIRRPELIQELCKTHKINQEKANGYQITCQ